MKDLSVEGREILNAKIEMFRALHQAHLYYKENERLQTKHGELNVFLQERKTVGWGEHVIDVAMAHIRKQENEIERLRAALEDIQEIELNRLSSYEEMEMKRIVAQTLAGETIDT